MNLGDFTQNLWREQTSLMWAASSFLILFTVLAIVSFFDQTQILGVNRWLKPLKFAVSIAIFLITVAAFLSFIQNFERSKSIVAWTTILTMIGEIVIVVAQAWRGTTSHFNTKTAIDESLFGLMGSMILLNTLAAIYLLFLYFIAEINLPASVVWGVRLGLILFLMASAKGGLMISQRAHTVGAADGGAGLPFFNWSVKAGDLRAAHFVGLHAIQILPVAALCFVWLQNRFPKISPTTLVFAFALLYFAAFNFLFVQAMRGKPLLKIEGAKAQAMQPEF